MKFALKGFFSIMLLIGAAGWTSKALADCASNGCSNETNDCGCTEVSESCCNNLCSDGVIYGKTFYAARSQGDNSARKMMGTERLIHLFGSDCFYGVGFVALEYQQGFRNMGDIGKWFSTNGANHMSYGVVDGIATSQTDFDINALQFGVTGSGTIAFCPKISDLIIDLNLYMGLDQWLCGLWARIDIPVAFSRRELNIIENVSGASSAEYPTDAGLNIFGADNSAEFAFDAYPMTVAFKGTRTMNGVPLLNFGKICGRRSETNVAGVRFDLGYDWFRRENWHFATSLDFVAPLGSTPSAEWLFDAMVGDSKRAQIGVTLNGAYEVWCNCDATNNIAFYADTTITTLLKKTVNRLAGFNVANTALTADQIATNSVWSQYLILKKFNSSLEVVGLERAANILAGDMKVGAAVIVDFALMAEWKCNCFFGGLGYELWLRSREKISETCLTIAANTYVNKGFNAYNTPEVAPATTIAQNGANIIIDSLEELQANSLSLANVDFCRALHPTALSNKLFGYAGYNWTECGWNPFVLIGGELEFGSSNKAISQWGIIGKGGISF